MTKVRQFANLSIEIIAKAHYSWLLEEDSADLLTSQTLSLRDIRFIICCYYFRQSLLKLLGKKTFKNLTPSKKLKTSQYVYFFKETHWIQKLGKILD